MNLRLAAPVWALLAAVLCAGASPVSSAATSEADRIVGRWLTEPRDGIIEISANGDGTYTGKIIGGNSPQRTDSHNPDPARRTSLLLGQVILKGLQYKGSQQWADGTIYDPDSGRTYHCNVQGLEPDTLTVRGFIGFSLLGRSQVWTRYQGSELTLPPAKH
ncbi:MAG TPA: DUF2147 domain-containing protein [Steroidobacteraceae bacterium]|nr:DUF2147 domain-containing protein [Steroidobacteraceae bacterium]